MRSKRNNNLWKLTSSLGFTFLYYFWWQRAINGKDIPLHMLMGFRLINLTRQPNLTHHFTRSISRSPSFNRTMDCFLDSYFLFLFHFLDCLRGRLRTKLRIARTFLAFLPFYGLQLLWYLERLHLLWSLRSCEFCLEFLNQLVIRQRIL